MSEEKEYIDGFEIHAIGWLFWLNMKALRCEKGLEVANCRAELFEHELKARSHIDPVQNIVSPRRVQFTGDVVRAMKKLLQLMADLFPDRFSRTALIARRRHFVGLVVVNFFVCYMASQFLPADISWRGSVIFTFLLMGLMSLFPLIILFRVTTMMKRLRIDAQ